MLQAARRLFEKAIFKIGLNRGVGFCGFVLRVENWWSSPFVPMEVVGETEALQKFFEGQDVFRALENTMVDTQMLEEFIENDVELFGSLPNKLPDSPPDSGSEVSPSLQINGVGSKCPCHVMETPSKSNTKGQICDIQQDSVLSIGNGSSLWNNLTPLNNLDLNCRAPEKSSFGTGQYLPSKKRKYSEIVEESVVFPAWSSDIGQGTGTAASSDLHNSDRDEPNGVSAEKGCRSLKWQPHRISAWSSLFNYNYERLPDVGYHIVTNKGFIFSALDNAFVCQKKNHFQITVHIQMTGTPKFIKTDLELKLVEMFYLNIFGIKMETPDQVVIIEQSQCDRSKKTFCPVHVDLPGDQVTKITLARLHFSETTANNMRKKGKPNPDQRYFMLVTGLYAVSEDQSVLVASHISERIIVRASSPGQFENDSSVLWQQGCAPEAIVCHGRVGINTDKPDEALVVCGNMKIMGAVMHPSDLRTKQNIQETDTHEQLRRIAQMRLVEYDYKPEFASAMGINQTHETGVIAQEIQEFLPNAVRKLGDFTYENGEKVDNFLMVDKEHIFMENVGAVKQLCKLTNDLEIRIKELEAWDTKLARLKCANGCQSTTANSKKPVRKFSQAAACIPSRKSAPTKPKQVSLPEKRQSWSSSRIFQITVIALVAVMALCIPEEDVVQSQLSNSTNLTFSPITTPTVTKYSPVPSNPKLPNITSEVNFCGILPCQKTYCCPTHQTVRRKRSPLKTKAKEERSDATISSMQILETQQKIDDRYCSKNLQCGSGNYSYMIPLNKHISVKVNISLEINTTKPQVIFQCKMILGNPCPYNPQCPKKREYFQESTQGFQHLWILPVITPYNSAYHFRVATPQLANCSTDPYYAGVFFTDYYLCFNHNCIL